MKALWFRIINLIAKLRLFVVRKMMRFLLWISSSDWKTEMCDGVAIRYIDQDFLPIVIEAMNMLKQFDPDSYRLVRRYLTAVVEIPAGHAVFGRLNALQFGITVKAYFDQLGAGMRREFGASRYAGFLVKAAVIVRIVDDFQVCDAWRRSWGRHRQVMAIGYIRELRTCRALNCKMSYIYDLERYVRDYYQGRGAKWRRKSIIG